MTIKYTPSLKSIKILLFFAVLVSMSCFSDNTELNSDNALTRFNSKVFEVSTKNAIIVWDEAKDLDKQSIHYSIILNNKKIVSDLEGVTYALQNLAPKTAYEGYIRAEDEKGNQSIASFTFKTPGNASLSTAL